MYRLYPTAENLTTVKSFNLYYELDMNGDNHEWRDCVSQFLDLALSLGSKVSPINVPPFDGHEDFIDLAYLIDNARVEFSSDSLLNLIEIKPVDSINFSKLWSQVGAKVGWVEISRKADKVEHLGWFLKIFN